MQLFGYYRHKGTAIFIHQEIILFFICNIPTKLGEIYAVFINIE